MDAFVGPGAIASLHDLIGNDNGMINWWQMSIRGVLIFSTAFAGASGRSARVRQTRCVRHRARDYSRVEPEQVAHGQRAVPADARGNPAITLAHGSITFLAARFELVDPMFAL